MRVNGLATTCRTRECKGENCTGPVVYRDGCGGPCTLDDECPGPKFGKCWTTPGTECYNFCGPAVDPRPMLQPLASVHNATVRDARTAASAPPATVRDVRTAAVPMPPLIMRLINYVF